MNDRLIHEVANQPIGNASGSTPSVRRKVIRLQDDADNADLRAHMLEWMIDSFPIGGQGHDRVRTLREGAVELRRTASLLLAPAPFETESAGSARTA